MKINENTSVVDVALNLSGSLAGLPVVVEQLPVGEPVGFDAMPLPGEDVEDIGQTWTPDLQNKEVDLDVPVYNPSAQQKEPYTTNLHRIAPAISDGEEWINALLAEQTNGSIKRVTDLSVGFNLRGCRLVFTMTHLKPKTVPAAISLNTRNYKGKDYTGEYIAQYPSSRIDYYPDYSVGASLGTAINVFNTTQGWTKKYIDFSPFKDNFIAVNNLAASKAEKGYWGWDYAYVIPPTFPNPRKKVCDIPVGYNLRGKTIYFNAPEMECEDKNLESAYVRLTANNEKGNLVQLVLYQRRLDQRYTIVASSSDGTIPVTNIYDSYKGSFIATKLTFPDDQDIIVTSNSLPAHTVNYKWGFDYAEVSDDATRVIPVPDIVRPYSVYRNLDVCNLNNWVNNISGQTPPLIAGGCVKYTTTGESSNGGGYFRAAVPYAEVGDKLIYNVQMLSALARSITLGFGLVSGAVQVSKTVAVSSTLKQFSEELTLSKIGDNSVYIAKLATETQVAGTYTARNFDVQLFKKLD